MLKQINVSCPYCGEIFDTCIDLSAGDQSYIEDCYVCCRPINFFVQVLSHASEEFPSFQVETRRDDE